MSRMNAIPWVGLGTVLVWFVLALPTAAYSAPIPAFTATYEAQALGNTLTAVIVLQPDGERWRMTLQARLSGWLRLIGRVEVQRESLMVVGTNGQLQPEFSTNHEITPRRERQSEIQFDWTNLRATGTVNSEPFTREISATTQDFLSSLLQTIVILRTGTTEPDYPLQILERNRLRNYVMRPAGRQRITTPLGRLEALGMIRADPSRGIELGGWFAPELNFLPIRLDYEAGSDVLQLNLKSVVWH